MTDTETAVHDARPETSRLQKTRFVVVPLTALALLLVMN